MDTRHFGRYVVTIADQLTDFYVRTFTAPPGRHRDPAEIGAAFRRRLIEDAQRPGFRAVVDFEFDDDIDGFATGWTTVAPCRTDRAYGKVVERLGAERVERLLVGRFEVRELAVRPNYRKSGIGRRLLTEVTGGRPAWLVARSDATDVVAFCPRAGWRELEPLPGQETDIVVFRSPAPADLVDALPLRDITARCGNTTITKARATVDLERSSGAPLEVVDSVRVVDEAWWFEDMVPMCLENLTAGIIEELTAQFYSDQPALRVVVREIFAHGVETNEYSNRVVGRRIVQEAIGRAAG